VFVAIITLAVVGRQTAETAKAAKATGESAKATEKAANATSLNAEAFINSQRAWINIRPSPFKLVTRSRLDWVAKNTGSTTARISGEAGATTDAFEASGRCEELLFLGADGIVPYLAAGTSTDRSW
jgi:hypothetical protein